LQDVRASVRPNSRLADEVTEPTLERWFTPDAPPELVERFRAMLDATDPEGYAACGEAVAGHDVIDQLGQIAVPTLVVSGDDDLSTPLEPHSRTLADGIPGARLAVIEHARHMANAERPELGAELTESFCRTDPEVQKRFARATFLSDNRSDLAAVRVPTLILQCTDDVIAPDAVGEYVHHQITGSRLVRLDASGHCPNLSAPNETVDAIRAFLAST